MQNPAYVNDNLEKGSNDVSEDNKPKFPRKSSLKPTVLTIPEENAQNTARLNLTQEEIERLQNIHSKTKRSVSILPNDKDKNKKDKKREALEKKKQKEAKKKENALNRYDILLAPIV